MLLLLLLLLLLTIPFDDKDTEHAAAASAAAGIDAMTQAAGSKFNPILAGNWSASTKTMSTGRHRTERGRAGHDVGPCTLCVACQRYTSTRTFSTDAAAGAPGDGLGGRVSRAAVDGLMRRQT